MKKKFYLLISFLISVSVFCNAQIKYEFENQEYYFCAYYDDLRSPPFKFSFYEGIFFIDIPEIDNEKIEEGKPIKDHIIGKYKTMNKDGLTYISVENKTYLVLYQKEIICVLIDCSNNEAFFGLNKNSQYVSVGNGMKPFIGITGQWTDSRRVSSFLTEYVRGKEIKYDGSKEKYYYELTKPWVEGVEGNGINEWIEIEPFGKVCGIVFFNGYIDPNRPDLFYANSRIKEIKINSNQGEFNFQIKDTPCPQILSFPNSFDGKLRLTIKDVYEGIKYSDTSLAGIYFLMVR